MTEIDKTSNTLTLVLALYILTFQLVLLIIPCLDLVMLRAHL